MTEPGTKLNGIGSVGGKTIHATPRAPRDIARPPAPGIGPVASTPALANDKPLAEAAKEPSSPPPQSAPPASLVEKAEKGRSLRGG